MSAMIRDISIRLLTVAIAPERSMSAKVRSMAIRPGRDSPTIGTTIVISTRNARKKLRCRSSRQKPGNRISCSATVRCLRTALKNLGAKTGDELVEGLAASKAARAECAKARRALDEHLSGVSSLRKPCSTSPPHPGFVVHFSHLIMPPGHGTRDAPPTGPRPDPVALFILARN